MGTITTWVITLRMVYTLLRQHLLLASPSLKQISKSALQMNNRGTERMLNVLSVFFKHNMQLLKVLPGCGVKLT
jgi:hypothetical protein